MKKFLAIVTFLLAMTTMVLLAADIDGTWTGEVQGFKGPTTWKLTLKADGKVLKGNVDKGKGPVEISEGTVDGNNVAFKIVQDFGGKQVTNEYKGALNGKTELKLTTQGKQGPQEIVLKK